MPMFVPRLLGAARPRANCTPIDVLPQDLLGDILEHLPLAQRATVAAPVCRTWRQMAQPSVSHRVAGALRGVRGGPQLLDALRAYPAPALAGLEYLDLRGRSLGDAGARDLCAFLRVHAPALRFLDLSNNGLTGRGAAALRLPARLSALNLAANDLVAAEPLTLPPALRALNLSCNPRLGSAYLAAQRWPAGLQLLAVAGCAMDFFQPPPGLVHLDVSGSRACSLPARDPGISAHVDTRGTRSAASGTWPSRHAAHPLPALERLLLRPLHHGGPSAQAEGLALGTGGMVGLVTGLAIATFLGDGMAEAYLGCGAHGALFGLVFGGILLAAADRQHNDEAIIFSKCGGVPWHSVATLPRPPARAGCRRVVEALLCGTAGGVASTVWLVALGAACILGSAMCVPGMLAGAVVICALGEGTAAVLLGLLVGTGITVSIYRGVRPALDRWAAQPNPSLDALEAGLERTRQVVARSIRHTAGALVADLPSRHGAAVWRPSRW